MILDGEEYEATLGHFEEGFVFLLEVDLSNEAETEVFNWGLGIDNDFNRSSSEFTSEFDALDGSVEVEVGDSVGEHFCRHDVDDD